MKEKNLLVSVDIYKSIYIYGAGMVGSLLFSRLKKNGIIDDRICFVVSRAIDGQEFLGHKVFDVSKCEFNDDSIVIVGVLPKNQKQIIDTLKKRGLDRYITVDEELFDDMEKKYISDYKESHAPIKGHRDILFMSSDNNYTSGAFLCMIDICNCLIERGIRPLVVLPGYGNGEQMLRDNSIDYVFVQSRSGLVGKGIEHFDQALNKAAVGEIEQLIKLYDIKIVHNNTNHGYVGAEAAHNVGVPYFWHLRENIFEQGFDFFDRSFIYGLINDANAVISVSEYVGKCYADIDSSHIRCIYDGLKTAKYYKERNILQSDKVRILMPGIMVPLKGQHQLVEAASLLKEDGIDFEISFVGSGDADYIARLESDVAKFGLNGYIHFYDRVSDLENWYFKSDIVVVCSKSEAFGRVTVEGQLAGCVVIGADCGATPELINDGLNGFLFELNDPVMLAKKIMTVVLNRERSSSIARRGQSEALTRYDRSSCCDKLVNLYNCYLEG